MSDNERAWQAASKVKATNVTWHFSHVGRDSRERLLNQKGATLWFTGLSASGKSTIAFTLEHLLIEKGYLPYVLDGDNVRQGLNKNLGFSADDRAENIRRIGEVARLFADAGIITMTSFISPYRMDRDRVRDLHDEANVPFVEIFVDTPIAVCEDRDPKGLYQRARAGEIKMFTGIDDPYEPPLEPQIVIRADELDPPACAEVIIERLQDMGITDVNGARPAV